MIRIREINPDDTGALVKLVKQLDRETEFLLYETGERPLDVDKWRENIRALNSPEYGTFFVAEYASKGEELAIDGAAHHESDGEDLSVEDIGSGAMADAVADDDTVLAGYLEVRRLPWRKVRHRIYLVIGILKKFRGMGVGTRLMQEAENWARRNDIQRLYLTVIAENMAAVQLYRKMGYETEGWHPASMRIGDRYVDELTMGKWLE